MTRWHLLLIAPPLLASSPAWSQPITIEDLARRVEALEQENASLRQEVERLSGARGAVSASPPATVATVPDRAPADAPAPPDADPWEGAYFGLNAGMTEAQEETPGGATLVTRLQSRDRKAVHGRAR